MNLLDYTFASTNLRVVHARIENLLNILLDKNPKSPQITYLRDCLKRLDTCSVYFHQTKNKLAETLANQDAVLLESQRLKSQSGVKDKKIKKLEEQLNELKKNINKI